ncbi:DUF6382 domain-containing protein [Helcococcus kunzii]|uniref:DUF6382 domain-containing protein n=1 Tax=Helcococcus kunzii ATCC 51366 TaxID=883114 RepID=H3NM69_9FIRM|nr:DUF6382 domain-containing protein [Helcococcus kunzii]EHR35478.1 hypothetical protein HMPREF9709_00430 [Helcococcus kunzii ATCC 51366]QUY64384.1 hypothetical protein GUI37_02165 [Helcococcus kunzii]
MIEKNYKKENSNTIVLNMIKNNKIDNILDYKINENKIIYNIDGKISLKEVIGNQINSIEFIKLIDLISKILITLESYMISSSNIYLNLEDIYMTQSRELYLMVNPSLNTNNDIKSMFQNIYLNKIIETKPDSINLIKINNYFNSNDYSVSGLRKMILNISNEKKDVEEEKNFKNLNSTPQKANNNNLKPLKKTTIFSRFFQTQKQNIVK